MFKHAMVVARSGNGAERCLPWLGRLMDAAASRVTLLTVLESGRRRGLAGRRVVTDEEVLRRAAYAALQGPAVQLGELGFDVKSVVRFDDPVANILEGVAASNVDVIALSIPFDEPSARWWRRSAVERLFGQTMVPVFVVRHGPSRFQRILVCLSADAPERVAEVARALADRDDATLFAVYEVVEGDVASRVCAVARRRAVDLVIANVRDAACVMAAAPCPILAVP